MAAVHKAGKERRRGATPATATLLPSSCKARDPVRPSEARPLRVRARRKKIGGPTAVTAKRVSAVGLTWFFVAMVITKRKRPETTRHLFAG